MNRPRLARRLAPLAAATLLALLAAPRHGWAQG